MDPGKIFQIITNSTLLATRLLSGGGSGPVTFSESRYCSVVPEDTPAGTTLATLTATHAHGEAVRYSITGGNRYGLFKVEQHTGVITLDAQLDYELHDMHELVVSAETESGSDTSTGAQAVFQVRVADVNDNKPYFLNPVPVITVIEEDDRDLPQPLTKVEAADADTHAGAGLRYSVAGDGVDGLPPSEAYFSINARTGELMQLRALDRDPPGGKGVWRVKVRVQDGQRVIAHQRENPSPEYYSGGDSRTAPQEPKGEGGNWWSRPRSYYYVSDVAALSKHADNGKQTSKRRRHWLSGNTRWREIRKREVTRGRRAEEGGKEEAEWRESADEVYDPLSSVAEEEMIVNQGASSRRNELPGAFWGFSHRTPTSVNSEWNRHRKSSFLEPFRDPSPGSRRSTINSNMEGQSPRQSDEFARLYSHHRKNRYDDVPTASTTRYKSASSSKRYEKGKLKSWRSTNHRKSRKNNQIKDHTFLEYDFLFHSYTNTSHVPNDPRKNNSPDSINLSPFSEGDPRSSRNPRSPTYHFNKHYLSYLVDEQDLESDTKKCNYVSVFGSNRRQYNITEEDLRSHDGEWEVGGNVLRLEDTHFAETVVTVIVKDINDNAPVFLNSTMYGAVQENGPADLSVAVVSAWDSDDATEGTNARLSYSIEKNVVDEGSGEAIFAVETETGVIRTALCCLDRETTPEYNLQVVATDGGGLKGTGTVVVRVLDLNDNSPLLARRQWDLEVNETWGNDVPDNKTILELTATDRDTANLMYYRVVESSGWGWDHFGIRSVGDAGQVYVKKNLDFEDETHRRGFKFMVQVTDMGRGGWQDPRHVDAAWITVTLKDVNDNAPSFARPNAHITVREDAIQGTLLAALPAEDPDTGLNGEVDYHVLEEEEEDSDKGVSVSSTGIVTLSRALDREGTDGDTILAKVVATDRGSPPLSSTATLAIRIKDVNDCPPVLLPPTSFHIMENSPPTLLGRLTATDHDAWALGHGPPFTLTLDKSNPQYVRDHIELKFSPKMDSGRGGAELWTSGSLDREEHRELDVRVRVGDAGGVSATHILRVVVGDINDNPMRPGSKTVYLWKVQGGVGDAPLGRVYVDDPDDWDVADKSYHWIGSPHNLFSLDHDNGDISASAQVVEGRYDLQFAVSDRVWDQWGVVANVTVHVRTLGPAVLAHAAPVTLTPTSPPALTKGWTPKGGGGGLGKLLNAVQAVIGHAHTVHVVSVYGYHAHLPHAPTPSQDSSSRPLKEVTCVWVCAGRRSGGFMDPVKLQGLLALHSPQLEAATQLRVLVDGTLTLPDPSNQPVTLNDLDSSSANFQPSRSLPLQLVDTNTTSLVTPRLTRAKACLPPAPADVTDSCTPTSCLNGGRCVGSSSVGNRCVCPGGAVGPRCKIPSRTFHGRGWAWLHPLTPCLPATLSLRVLTLQSRALLLYSGPLTPTSTRPPTPMLALQVVSGRPQFLYEGPIGRVKVEVMTKINDGEWHTLHLRLHSQGVTLMVDMCGRGWEDSTANDDSHCASRAPWPHPEQVAMWMPTDPLQVGGMAHPPPRSQDHGWGEGPVSTPLEGCVSHLTTNGELMDLGSPPDSLGSAVGCLPQEAACRERIGGCGVRGACVGGLRQPECECPPGWAGKECDTPTTPVSLASSSYVKVALSFTPSPWSGRVQLRVRTSGARNGLLLHLAAHHHHAALALHLQAGVACASVSGTGWAEWAACVEGRPVGDGEWHTIRAERYGNNLVVTVDDGDGWKRNDSLVTLEKANDGRARQRPPALDVDKQEGVAVGGLPVFQDTGLSAVHADLQDTCVDDVRVCGRPLPLPPAENNTNWGQVTTVKGVQRECAAIDACANTTCATPLSCSTSWGKPLCSCGPGRQLSDLTCVDVDECAWEPCLHGGTCYNLQPGFTCVCGPAYTGQHCQWAIADHQADPLAVPAAVLGLTFSCLILVLVCVLLSLRCRRQLTSRLQTKRREAAKEGRKGSGVACKAMVGGVNGETVITESTAMDVLGCSETFVEDLGGGGRDTSAGCVLKSTAVGTEEGSPSTKTCERVRFKLPHVTMGERDPTEEVSLEVISTSPRPTRSALRQDHLMPNDDLRAYAYEGDGSSSGSLTSTISRQPSVGGRGGRLYQAPCPGIL